jgi:hypothetical protein
MKKKGNGFPTDFQIESAQHPFVFAILGAVVFCYVPLFLISLILHGGEPKTLTKPATVREHPVIRK